MKNGPAAVPTFELGCLADLRARALAGEREEEALVAAAHAAGIDLPRRLDASPQVVLGVEVEGSAARAA